jgi:hypothetical protein
MQALAAWRRARNTDDPLARVTFLFEAIEIYAATSNPPLLFVNDQLPEARKRASEGLSEAQKERNEIVFGRANQAPLRTRLKLAIGKDEVPVTEEDIEVLWRVREARNAVEHGGSRSLPEEDDLRCSQAIVNRMLVFRMARLR